MTAKRRRNSVQNLNKDEGVAGLRTALSRAVGKVCAYRNVGKETEAKEWAEKLVEVLKKNGLVL